MVRHSALRWQVCLLLALTGLAGGCAVPKVQAEPDPRTVIGDTGLGDTPHAAPPLGVSTGAEQDIVHLDHDVGGDARDATFTADEIYTWNEEGCDVLLLRGSVLIRQGTVETHFQQGVAWLGTAQRRSTGILRIELYGEGNVLLDDGNGPRRARRLVCVLHTRGTSRLANKAIPRPLASDPLVARARAEALGPVSLRRQGVQHTTTHKMAYHDPALQRTAYTTTTDAGPPAVPGVPVQGAPDGAVAPAPAPGPPGPSPGVPLSPALPGVAPVTPPGYPVSPGAPGAGGGPSTLLPPPTPLPPAPQHTTPRPTPRRNAGGPPREYTISPRNGTRLKIKIEPLPSGESAILVTGGVIITVRNVPGVGTIDVEADRVVVWTQSNDPQQLASNLQSQKSESSRQLEFYLAGHVEIRQQPPTGRSLTTIAAEEIYYDVNRNVAVALTSRLKLIQQPGKGGKAPIVQELDATADELIQLSPTKWQVIRGSAFSSKLPSDPGLDVTFAKATIEDRQVPVSSWPFGLGPPRTDENGKVITVPQSPMQVQNAFIEMGKIPIFYAPYLQTDARNPLGPIQEVNGGFSQIYGFQASLVLNMYTLLGIQPVPNTSWRLNLDYLSYRGPGLGTSYNYGGKDLFSIPNTYTGSLQAWGIYDRNFDNLGGARPYNNFSPTAARGFALWRQGIYDLPEGFSIQSQFEPISDRNFVEQYFKRLWDTDVNQTSWMYVKQQPKGANYAWTGLVESPLRTWVTATNWLPRFDGWLIGQDLLDILNYNVHGSATYAKLQASVEGPPYRTVTDRTTSTGRFDVMQELTLPFYLGPIKLAPYGMLDLTSYTNNLQDNSVGRYWVAGGLRGSMPLSRLYPTVESELFNLKALNHKMVLSANYINAYSNVNYSTLPQLDRLNDIASDQSLRDILPVQSALNPTYGNMLAYSPVFDPQMYAIQRAVLTNIDTLNTIQVLQMDVRQRLQTKRGYPGSEHIIDWMILDTSASYFPAATRDNFGHNFAFLQYDYLWNIGDRTALASTAWIDPYPDAPHVFTFGAYFNRPDRTNYYLGYRELYPLQSKLLTGSMTYVFSPKYAATLSLSYDFGIGKGQSNSITFTRMGTDLSIGLGLTYNSLQNTFGFMLQIIPNLVPANKRPGGLGSSSMQR